METFTVKTKIENGKSLTIISINDGSNIRSFEVKSKVNGNIFEHIGSIMDVLGKQDFTKVGDNRVSEEIKIGKMVIKPY